MLKVSSYPHCTWYFKSFCGQWGRASPGLALCLLSLVHGYFLPFTHLQVSFAWNKLGFFTRTIHFVWGMLSFFLFISGLFSVQAFVQISPSALPLLTLSRRILMKASYVISILAFPTPNSPFVHLLLLCFCPLHLSSTTTYCREQNKPQ